MDVVQALEVVVPSVEDVERVFLVRDGVHRLHIVDPSFCDVEECRNRGFNVIQRMNLDTSFLLILAVYRPVEGLEAKLDSR